MPFKVVVHGGEHNAGSCKRKQSSTKGRKSTKRKKSTMKSQLQTQSTTKKMEKSSQLKQKKIVGESESESESEKKNQLKPSSPKKVLGESENICHYSADCPYVPPPEVLEYSKVVQESEGFTSIPATGKLADGICGGIRPTGVNRLVKEAARFAVAQQNKKVKNITLPLNLLPLSWGKTICVGRGSALKIIEVMQQRPYGVRWEVSDSVGVSGRAAR